MSSQAILTATSRVIPFPQPHKLSVVKKPGLLDRNEGPTYKDTIAIPMKGKIEMIALSEIIYVAADSNYIRFYLNDNRMILAAKTLKEISALLERAEFMRVHKSFMLHPSSVRQYDLHKGLLLLRCGEKIPVSRSNRKSVADKLLTWSC